MSQSNSRTKARSYPSRAELLLVGLTGGIASGKSVVSGLLEQKGCIIFHADDVSRKIVGPGFPAWKRIVARFGRNILLPDTSIDRAALASIVFNDPAARQDLEGIIHPLVLIEQKKLIARTAREKRSALFVTESALIFETRQAPFFDRIVVVHCRRDIQLARVAERYGISKRKAAARVGAQMAQREKLKMADYSIDTSGSLAETIERTERVYAGLMLDRENKLRNRSSWLRRACS